VTTTLPPPQRSTRRVAPRVALVLLLAGAAWLLLEAPTRDGQVLHRAGGVGSLVEQVAGRTCPRTEGPFGPGHWPSACWRPYSGLSPFNKPLPSSPRIAPQSDAVVRRLMSFGGPQNINAGQAGTRRDFGHPTYWSRRGDPWFRIHCTKPWGRCALEGLEIQIPDRARVPGGSDGHMTVVDQRSGWEYDMWRVQYKPRGGGELVTAWGGRTRTDGLGLGSDAVAGEYGTMAGLLRAEELQAGQVNHALFMFAYCDSGTAVYPAVHAGRPCSHVGLPTADAPPMGARFQLDMSRHEIDALDVPEWKKAILRAMARYGMYLGDTGGSWGVKEEGGLTYTSFGYPDRWVRFAKSVGAPYYAPHGTWVLDLASGVDWASRLRMIDPCESSGTCG
jgi:hypothetical protein